jgi:DNA-binding transcriptional regulator YdaS (Cro superfamily)
MTSFRSHVERAIELKGSQAKLAADMGCSQQYISWLLKEADQISAEQSIACERATEGQVTRWDLRPDLFGQRPAPEQQGAA